jgi:hypothetical protein
MNNNKLKLFICTSITNVVGKPNEIAKLRALIETIDRTAEERGAITFCALREENWLGEEDPARYVPRDLGWSRQCDGAILIPGNSHGVRIEMGWLTILQKPMLRLYDGAIAHKSDLEKNLHHVVTAFDRAFESCEDAARHVSEFIDFLKQ